MTVIVNILIIVAAGVIGLGVVSVILTMTKAHKVRVLDPLNKNDFVNDYLVVPKKNKINGTIDWVSVFWQPKFKIAEPPKGVADIGKKGKLHLTVQKLSEDEFVYMISRKNLEKEDLIKIDGHDALIGYQSFSITQRDVVINQFKKAEAERNNSWLRENALNLTAMGVMMIIIVMGMMYFGEISQAMLSREAQSSSILAEIKGVAADFGTGAKAVTPQSKPKGGVVSQGEQKPS